METSIDKKTSSQGQDATSLGFRPEGKTQDPTLSTSISHVPPDCEDRPELPSGVRPAIAGGEETVSSGDCSMDVCAQEEQEDVVKKTVDKLKDLSISSHEDHHCMEENKGSSEEVGAPSPPSSTTIASSNSSPTKEAVPKPFSPPTNSSSSFEPSDNNSVKAAGCLSCECYVLNRHADGSKELCFTFKDSAGVQVSWEEGVHLWVPPEEEQRSGRAVDPPFPTITKFGIRGTVPFQGLWEGGSDHHRGSYAERWLQADRY